MQRSFICWVILFALVVAVEAQDETGSWTARLQKSGHLSLNIQDDRGSNFGSTYSVNQFRGLSQSPQGAVEFQLQNEPGTFYFQGTFSDGHGGGIYTFQSNPQFVAAMKNLGYALSSKNIKLMAKCGFRIAYIHEWKSLGYSDLRLDDVIKMMIHEVTPEYIKALASLGYKSLPRERVVEMRIHDITPEYIDALKRAGYADLSAQQLIEFSISDVTPEKIAEYRKLGYDHISPKDLSRMSIHDVDPEFITELKKVGYSNLPVDRLIQFSIHDVTPRFIEELAREGFGSVKPDDLVAMRIHDVDANFIRRAKRDHQQLTVRQLIELRIHED